MGNALNDTLTTYQSFLSGDILPCKVAIEITVINMDYGTKYCHKKAGNK